MIHAIKVFDDCLTGSPNQSFYRTKDQDKRRTCVTLENTGNRSDWSITIVTFRTDTQAKT